MLVTNVSAQNM